MAFTSLEVRWFFEGNVKDAREVTRWFRDPARPAPAAPQQTLAWPSGWRRDVYLVIPGHPELGIKWRRESESGNGARLELKGLVSVVGHVELSPRIHGTVERWSKWSLPGGDVPTSLSELFGTEAGAPRVPVRKRRLLRRYGLDLDGERGGRAAGGPGWLLDQGIGFELTEVEVSGRPFWTLGLEAWPDSAEVRRLFRTTAARLLEGLPGPPLEVGDSASYPRWLQRFV